VRGVSARRPSPSDRHHRQAILPGFGADAQERLRASHALVVGCGALGCATIDLLARAGVGRLTLVDRDVVEVTNLQRQSLYVDADARAGTPQAEAAARRVRAIDPGIRADACVEHVGPEAAAELVPDCDLVVDGLDNYRTRYLLNDAAVRFGRPFVHAGAVGLRGTSMPVLAGAAERLGTARTDAPCLRCLFPDVPPAGEGETCDTAGVLGPLAAMVGAHAAAQAIALLAGVPALLDRSLWSVDMAVHRTVRVPLAGASRDDCPCCALRRFEFLDAEDERCAVLCGRNAVQVRPARASTIDMGRMRARLANAGDFAMDDGRLVGTVGGGLELTVFGDGRAIVRGTADPVAALAAYARYVGE
jgi:adenylyltransferase/sulfurtransferase